MIREYDSSGIAIPPGAPRPPRRGAKADRAFAANVLGTFALTVSASLVGIVVTGCTVGSLLPILLKRIGLDPATSSTPFIASLVDVLGIVKAYTTRVGAGPFPTELFDETGEYLQRVGHEFGAVTGRRRRCGWFDAIALRRSIVHSSVSGLCMTKLDVLDGLDTIRICVGYRRGGETLAEPPLLGDGFAEVEPVYEEMPGWKESTVGVTRHELLPRAARDYLARIEDLAGVPIDVVSTGPERDQTIVLRHPFG